MTRKTLPGLFIGILAMLVVLPSHSLLGQHQHDEKQAARRDTTTSQPGMMMSREMMQEMERNHQAVEEALRDVRAAQKSDDPKVHRAALEKAESTLSRLHDHMTSHEKMMREMHQGGQTQGPGRMMQHRRMQDSTMKDHKGMQDDMRGMDSTMKHE